MEILIDILRFIWIVIMFSGLWYSMNGVRVVVSGRVDERARSAKSLKRGLLLLAIGVALALVLAWLSIHYAELLI